MLSSSETASWKKKKYIASFCLKYAKEQSKRFFHDYEIFDVCKVKMRVAPSEVEMFCPKCGVTKEHVFVQNPSWQKKYKKVKTRDYFFKSIKLHLHRKGFNFDVMLIEQVGVVFNALNDLVHSDKKIKYRCCIPRIIDFSTSGAIAENDFICHSFLKRLTNNMLC